MKPHHISAVCAFAFLSIAAAALAQTQLNSGEITRSLQGVSGGRIALTAAEMRQAAIDNIRNYPGPTAVAHPLSFPQLANLAQFTVEINFDFNSAAIRPESYRTVGAIADALHNPILLGYGFLVVGHTDSVGKEDVNLQLSVNRATAVRDYILGAGIYPARIAPLAAGENNQQVPTTQGVRLRANRVVVVSIK